jgi:hypothetical protein
MMCYLPERLIQTAFLLVGVSFLTFLFSSLAAGNYSDDMRLNPQISAETLSALRAQYQLDQPLPIRYFGANGARFHLLAVFSRARHTRSCAELGKSLDCPSAIQRAGFVLVDVSTRTRLRAVLCRIPGARKRIARRSMVERIEGGPS